MSHCIHAIVAADPTADVISIRWPELRRLRHKSGFSIFPVNYELIDAKIAPAVTPTETGEEFMLLTPAFHDYLRELSAGGVLAYVETEYFGGVGGQGALVVADGIDKMPPNWSHSGTINEALKTIGVPRGLFADRFAAIGFASIRDNDDMLDCIDSQSHQTGG